MTDNKVVEYYKVVEVKPGVYVKIDFSGSFRLTNNVTEASKYDGYNGQAQRVANKYYGTVKRLTVTTEVE